MGGAAGDWGDLFASSAGYRGGPATAASPPLPRAQATPAPPPPSPPRPPDVVIGVGCDGGTAASPRRATADGPAGKPPPFASAAAAPPRASASGGPAAAPAQNDWEAALLNDLLAGDRAGAGRRGRLGAAAAALARHAPATAAVALAAGGAAVVLGVAPHARILGVSAWRYLVLAAAVPVLWAAAPRVVAAVLAAADGRVVRSTAALLALAGARGPAVRLVRAAALAAAVGAATADYDGAADGAPQHAALAVVAKLLACATIAAAASLLARVGAAWLAASLYARAHAVRVRDALDKEFYLWALSQPRPGGDGGGGAGGAAPPSPPASDAATPLVGPPQPPPAAAPPPPAPAARAETGAALAALEAHVREHQLALPLADALGAVRPPSSVDAAGAGGPPTPSPTPATLTDAADARHLALYLFWHVRGAAAAHRPHLERGDLAPFLDAAAGDAAWRLLDPAGTGRASASAVRDAVAAIHTQRAHLAAALAGARASAASLEAALAAAAHAAALLAYCGVFGVDAGRALLTASSVLVATAFIFGNTLRSVFESAAFVYGVHAFDVGDVLLVDGVWHQVVGASLLHTRLQRWDGVRLWYPNARLAADPVANVSRSAPRWEGFRVAVDVTTKPAAVDAVAAAVAAHLKARPAEYTGEHLVVCRDAADPMKMALCVWWEYAHPAADLGRTSRARHALYMAVGAALEGAGILYTLPPFGGGGAWPGGGGGGPPAAVAAAAAHAGGGTLNAGPHAWP